MRRRDFLKGLSAFCLASAVPPGLFMGGNREPAPAQWADFDPEKMYGDWFTVTDSVLLTATSSNDAMMMVLEKVDRSIAVNIPPGYRKDVDYVLKKGYQMNDPLCQRMTVGWKYTPKSGKKVVFRRYEPFKMSTEPLSEGVTPPGRGLTYTEERIPQRLRDLDALDRENRRKRLERWWLKNAGG